MKLLKFHLGKQNIVEGRGYKWDGCKIMMRLAVSAQLLAVHVAEQLVRHMLKHRGIVNILTIPLNVVLVAVLAYLTGYVVQLVTAREKLLSNLKTASMILF